MGTAVFTPAAWEMQKLSQAVRTAQSGRNIDAFLIVRYNYSVPAVQPPFSKSIGQLCWAACSKRRQSQPAMGVPGSTFVLYECPEATAYTVRFIRVRAQVAKGI